MNTLPTTVQDFLLLLVASPVILGTLTAFLLARIFAWWEGDGWHTVASHDKVLVSSLAPTGCAILAWAGLAALGYQDWTLQAAAQAIYVGFVATVGGQWAYGAISKLTSPLPHDPA